MSTIEEGLYIWATGNGTISTLISTRFYPDVLPQKPTLPAVVYRRVGSEIEMAHDGPLDLEYARFRFHCYGSTPKIARSVAGAIKSELNGLRATIGLVALHGAFFITQQSDFEDVTGVSRSIVDFNLVFKTS
ncbi:MAG: DUF3168 domain-containing protein [Anaerolineae bacterium]|nr:DUF3168 domain-containing protein [Anaerolineae bacterium]